MDRERRNTRWINILGLALILLLTGEVILLIRENAELRALLNSPSNGRPGQLIQSGDIVTPFSYQLPTADSGSYSFSSWAPNTLVFLFSTSCPFCEQNIPKWAILDGASSRSDINILWISVDPPAITAAYLRDHEIPYRVISSYIDTSFQVRNRLNGVPITLLMDSVGKVERVWPGTLNDEQFIEIITVLTDSVGLGTELQKPN